MTWYLLFEAVMELGRLELLIVYGALLAICRNSSKLRILSDNLEENKRILDNGDCFKIDKLTVPSECIQQCNDFVTSELESIASHWFQVKRGRVGLVKRAGEQNLERRAKSLSLELSPNFALFAADAVHDARYVAKVMAELFLQLTSLFTTPRKHARLVEMRLEFSAKQFDFNVCTNLKTCCAYFTWRSRSWMAAFTSASSVTLPVKNAFRSK